MKDNEITSFDKELNEFLQPKCLIIQETPSLNWAFLVCIELRVIGQKVCVTNPNKLENL